MAELAEAATEAVAEVAEEVADGAEHVAELSRGLEPREIRLLMTGIGVGLVGGVVIGGWYINRRMRLEYEKLVEQEVDEMREHFRARLVAKEEKPDLSEAAEAIVKREGYDGPATPMEVPDEETSEEGDEEAVVAVEEVEVTEVEASEAVDRNLFEDTRKDSEEGWDYEEEIKLRRPEFPYVIHYDERGEQDGYTEVSLVYYAEDDVLCDAHDTPVDDKEKVVGENNLEKFGHGSNDKNVVYLRNEVLQLEVEVVRNDGSYAEVVHGLPSVKHSATREHRGKPRFDDEPGAG